MNKLQIQSIQYQTTNNRTKIKTNKNNVHLWTSSKIAVLNLEILIDQQIIKGQVRKINLIESDHLMVLFILKELEGNQKNLKLQEQGLNKNILWVKDKWNGQLQSIKNIFEYCSITMLQRVIKIQRKQFHSNILQLYNYFEDKENVYLILEYIENGSLLNKLKKSLNLFRSKLFPQKQNDSQRFKIQIDLPENLLQNNEGIIKICDFIGVQKVQQRNV
ncbi:unnamed protein product [Paramecium sonneborni]|uniref:Protein kinase domain-containing protein n=1 Tax=Paramecium sonneborni TaxID=65129 RepID=A0A8S1P2I6_9CILI|nr:unnamed protein product [Paramecium sonneborni]